MVDNVSAHYPKGTAIAYLASEMDATKDVVEEFQRITITEPLRELRNETQQLRDQEMQALQDVAENNKWLRAWSYGHLVGSLATGVSYLALGFLLKYHGEEEEGRRFIVPSAIVLTNGIMGQVGGWDIVARVMSLGNQRLYGFMGLAIPLGMHFASMWYTIPAMSKLSDRALNKLPAFLRTNTNLITKVNAVVQLCIQIGTLATKIHKLLAERRLMEIQGKLEVGNMRIDAIYAGYENITEILQTINGAFKKAIRSIFNGTSAAAMGRA